LENDWIDEVKRHLIITKNVNGYWTLTKCIREAKKFKTISEMRRSSKGAYCVVIREKWGEKCFKHMKRIGHLYERAIYHYIFDDNSYYVGLTFNYQKRHKQHLLDEKSAIYRKVEKGISYKYKRYNKWLSLEKSLIEEQKIDIKLFKRGLTRLNKAPTGISGSLGGGPRVWTKDACLNEALKYKSRKEFSKKSPSAYNKCRTNNWLEIACIHMRKVNKWTFEKCKMEAKKFKTRSDFARGAGGAYGKCKANSWLDKVCNHMTPKPVRWNLTSCKMEALKYRTKTEFYRGSGGAYKYAQRNGLLQSICRHMKKRV
jgi:predicted GIY-YIG superfamily endonuclease